MPADPYRRISLIYDLLFESGPLKIVDRKVVAGGNLVVHVLRRS